MRYLECHSSRLLKKSSLAFTRATTFTMAMATIATSTAMTTTTTTTAKPTLRGIVFDMDGTLTVPNLDFTEMYRRCGVSRSDDILKAVKSMEPAEAERANDIIEEMEEEGRRTLRLKPGALELGRWLHHYGIPMSIVTRNTAKTVDTLVTKLWNVEDHKDDDSSGSSSSSKSNGGFSPIISRDSPADIPFKPDPAAAHYIAKEWSIKLPTKDLVMVGDSPSNDIVFGNNAGISTILVDETNKYKKHNHDGDNKNKNSNSDPKQQPNFTVQHLWQIPNILWTSFCLPPIETKTARKPEPTSSIGIAANKGDLNTLISDLSSSSSVEPTASNFLSYQEEVTGNTPLIWACDAGQTKVVEWLLLQQQQQAQQKNKNNPVNIQGYLGCTAIHRATRWNHCGILERLLRVHGANPNIPNHKLQYPLHIAAFNENLEAVKLLLNYDASTFVLDRKGRTPLEETKNESIRNAILQFRKEKESNTT